MVFKINIHYKIFLDENLEMHSIFEYLTNKSNILYHQKQSCIHKNLVDITKSNKINREISNYLSFISMPDNLLFTLVDNKDIDDEYLCIKEIFSGKTFIVDKLVLICKINKIKANIELFNYSLEQINTIQKIIPAIDFNKEFVNNDTKYLKSKIIKFPNNKKL